MFKHPFENVKKTIGCLCILLLSVTTYAQNEYQKGWEALGKNDRKEARLQFQSAIKDAKQAADAAVSLIYLNNFEAIENDQGLWATAQKTLDNPSPYIFGLWFQEALGGDYGEKTPAQEAFLRQITLDPKANITLKSSAYYQLGMHYLFKQEKEKSNEHFGKVNVKQDWQVVGPFDNLSGGGFNQEYAPIREPKPTAVFKSYYDYDIQWFNISEEKPDGWISPCYNIRSNTAIIYAQSFVTSPTDREAIFSLGFKGTMKVWINDKLVLKEPEERLTDLDVYKVKVKLNKGVNRVLLQLGFDDVNDFNFTTRFLDLNEQVSKDIVYAYQYQDYTKDLTTDMPAQIPFFAEKYFEDKIQAEPNNLVNYTLLADIYLRSKKIEKALKVIDKALEMQPKNSLLKYKQITCFYRAERRTDLTQAMEFIKENDPDSYVSLDFKLSDAEDSEKYADADDILERRASIYGKNEGYYEKKIDLLAKRDKVKELLDLLDFAYKKYPNSATFVSIKSLVALKVNKNPSDAIAILETYLKKHFNSKLTHTLIEMYFEMGKKEKALALLEKYNEAFSEDPETYLDLFNYYYNQKDNKKAEPIINQMLKIAPYSSRYWENYAMLHLQSGNQAEARKCLEKLLTYSPNNFDARKTIRELDGKKPLQSYFPAIDPYELAKKSDGKKYEADQNWYTILQDKSTIIYPERTSEVYYTYLVRVLNEKGIDVWKESEIGFNRYRQRLTIEKAEVIKPNGSKILAERNRALLVFPKLEKGDAILIQYKIATFAYDKMSREFWDKGSFNNYVPVEHNRYSYLVDNNVKINYKTLNCDIQPQISEAENYKLYVWEAKNLEAQKEESLMPTESDVLQFLHVSTMTDWSKITDWYNNISSPQAIYDYTVEQVMDTLMPHPEQLTELERAKKIYHYILKNITYSSVSFRQTSYVPQTASKTIQTKLGDCKDMSTLFVAMARKAGLTADLVLLNSRNSGLNDILLPSVEFTHCIAKVKTDKDIHYIELTNPYIPFGCLPPFDIDAFILDIPFGTETNKNNQPTRLNPSNRILATRYEDTKVDIQDNNFVVETHSTPSGYSAATFRNQYVVVDEKKMKDKYQKTLASDYKKTVEVKSVKISGLENIEDSVELDLNYVVKAEVIEMGDMKMFQVPYYDTYFKSDILQEENRTMPVCYSSYEDIDSYTENLSFHLPEGKKFTQVPENLVLSFEGSTYSLTFTLQDDRNLLVNRTIHVNNNDIPLEKFDALKKYIQTILTTEAKYIGYK